MRRDSGISVAVEARAMGAVARHQNNRGWEAVGQPGNLRWASMIGSRVIFQLLAAGRELRTIVGSQRRAAEVRAVMGARDGKTSASVSFITADREYDEGRLDDASGCEFIDDRIRLLE